MTACKDQRNKGLAAQFGGQAYRACEKVTSEYGSYYYWWYNVYRPDAAMHP